MPGAPRSRVPGAAERSRRRLARLRRRFSAPARARRRGARRAARFVRAHAADLRGRVLVAADPALVQAVERARGGAPVSVWADDPKRLDATHVSPVETMGRGALPADAFDAVVVGDARACSAPALEAISDALTPGGTLLAVTADQDHQRLRADLAAAGFTAPQMQHARVGITVRANRAPGGRARHGAAATGP